MALFHTVSQPGKTTTRDMSEGSIVKAVLLFALPLMLGNAFQMLYNTVDSIVVGNFVGTQALAAVGSTTMIVNMMVFFFNGFSAGAGVVISRCFGARDMERLQTAIHTTMAATFGLSAIFTVVGVALVKFLLRIMDTPEDVMPQATIYLQIYIGGISGLLVYNMGSGILRAVGDSTRPLYFLILTSILNILLDLLFVLVFRMGIAGVAIATVLAQFVSAWLTLRLLIRSRDIYRMSWKKLAIDLPTLREIFAVGLPAGIQSILTAFSNVFVQAYINGFGSACMAGWSCYNKLDQFILLPMQSMAMASTTFVGQNIGAKKYRRADSGTWTITAMATLITGVIAGGIFLFSGLAVGLFTKDAAVVEFGVLFLRNNVFFLMFNCVNHVLAGALRGRGDSRGPMIIMLATFVGLRQIYLYWVTHYIANTPTLVGYGYPVGWAACCIVELSYYFLFWYGKTERRLSNE